MGLNSNHFILPVETSTIEGVESQSSGGILYFCGKLPPLFCSIRHIGRAERESRC